MKSGIEITGHKQNTKMCEEPAFKKTEWQNQKKKQEM